MNTTRFNLISFAVLALAALPIHAADSRISTSTPVTQLKYFATGVKNSTGELQAAPAYGDLSRAAHGTFIKMPAGFVSNVHTHTEDYYGVVISGVGVNSQGGNNDVPLPVGSYWLQKGGEAHITKCISPNECIFFISQPGKFDYLEPTRK
jgi:hypothetical protein